VPANNEPGEHLDDHVEVEPCPFLWAGKTRLATEAIGSLVGGDSKWRRVAGTPTAGAIPLAAFAAFAPDLLGLDVVRAVLEQVGDDFGKVGVRILQAESYALASMAFRRAGDAKRATSCESRARQLAVATQAHTPLLQALEGSPLLLDARTRDCGSRQSRTNQSSDRGATIHL